MTSNKGEQIRKRKKKTKHQQKSPPGIQFRWIRNSDFLWRVTKTEAVHMEFGKSRAKGSLSGAWQDDDGSFFLLQGEGLGLRALGKAEPPIQEAAS